MTERSPIVRLFFAKMKQEFFDLPEDERAEFMRKDRSALDALGMKAIYCSAFTSEWDYIGSFADRMSRDLRAIFT